MKFSAAMSFLSFIKFVYHHRPRFAHYRLVNYGWTFDRKVAQGAATEASQKVDG